MNSSYNAQNAYKETGIKTASQGQLIVRMYKGAIKFLNLAEKHIEEENYMEANEYMQRVQAIVNELRYSLDHEKGGEVSKNLEALYDFMYRSLVKANMNNDLELLDQVRNMLKELLESWQEVQKKAAAKGKVNKAAKLSVNSK